MPAFEISHTDGVAHLTFTRPEASNAMGGEFWSDFGPAIDQLSRDGQTRALVISGQGNTFCAGMDLSLFAGKIAPTEKPAQREAFYHLIKDMQDVLSTLEKARFPVIAAIQGACLGAGLDLVAACDLRVVSADAYFRLEEINIGMMADVGVLQRLPKLMPEGIAREMAFMGTTLTATRAEAIGFANAIEPDADAMLARALDMAATIAAKSPLAVTGSKSSLNYARDHSIVDALDHCALMQSALWQPADIMTAFVARSKKAAPDYQNLDAVPPKPGSPT